jgi:hypothetical protein
MIPSLLNISVTVKRRTAYGSVTRDALNNPVYGTPTSGAGWTTAYTAMPVRLAFSQKKVDYTLTGERVLPSGIMYYGKDFTILAEDRVITPDGIEYVVLGVVPGYVMGAVVDHYEAQIALP